MEVSGKSSSGNCTHGQGNQDDMETIVDAAVEKTIHAEEK